MKKIDESIRSALRDAALDSGSVLKLSKKLGVSHSTVLFWSSGRTKCIDGDVWRYKVYPALERYLLRRCSWAKLGEERAASHGDSSQQQISTAVLHEVPVLGLAQAAGFDPAIEPFETYARGCCEETALFAASPKKGHFALKVEGRSMEPEFPDGTLILVAGGEFVESGDVVAARIRAGGQVVVKKYLRIGSKLRLESLNEGGAAFEWDVCSNRGYLEWMHPVVEAKVDLRARRILSLRAGQGASFAPEGVRFKEMGASSSGA